MIKKFFILLPLVLLFSQTADACGCTPTCSGFDSRKQCVMKRIKFSSAVIFGKVTAIELIDNSGGYRAKFTVEKAWKSVKSKEVFIRSESDTGANCGIDLKIGEKYLVYAIGEKNRLFAGGCEIGNESDVQYLGKANKLKK